MTFALMIGKPPRNWFARSFQILTILLLLGHASSADSTTTRSSNIDENINLNGGSVTATLPPIFVLNLDRAKDRWATASAVMAEAGLDVTRLPAVDGKALKPEELRANSTGLARWLQPRGVLGCYLSHRKFWQMVVERNYSAAIVFEDDVQLVDSFKEKLLKDIAELPSNYTEEYDVLFLGAIGRVHPQGKDSIGSLLFAAYTGGNRPLIEKSPTVYQPRRPAGTHAYMVTKKGAQRLLDLCPQAVYHVDLDAWRHKSLVLGMFNPMLVYQTFESTSLTDTAPSKQGGRSVRNLMVHSKLGKRMDRYARDPFTHQPWSHVLAEPMMQFGPKGLVLTVERYCGVLIWGSLTACALEMSGYRGWARAVTGAVFGFIVSVRSLIWVLQNWR